MGQHSVLESGSFVAFVVSRRGGGINDRDADICGHTNHPHSILEEATLENLNKPFHRNLFPSWDRLLKLANVMYIPHNASSPSHVVGAIIFSL